MTMSLVEADYTFSWNSTYVIKNSILVNCTFGCSICDGATFSLRIGTLLLERTQLLVSHERYNVVNSEDEIPIVDQPRIVKLHGSLGGHYPLIATENDYLLYPEKHAAFVNTVQQAMMETALILIGFSGSDPNFLRWSSWVRDNLGDAAPKIFLAGWLDLSDSEREELRRRNVNSIDLARHPDASTWAGGLCHRYATEWILRSLEAGRPYDATNWPEPRPESTEEIPQHLESVEVIGSEVPKSEEWSPPHSAPTDEMVTSIRDMIEIWSHNRRLYPNWVVAPSEKLSYLTSKVGAWGNQILATINELNSFDRFNIIRELLWRHEIILLPMSPELEKVAVETLSIADANPELEKQIVRESRREISLALVTAARYQFDEIKFLRRIEEAERFVDDDPGVLNFITHERCLWSTWKFDFEKLDHLLTDWDTTKSDPMWHLRKAALLREIGREVEATDLVNEAMEEIRQIRSMIGAFTVSLEKPGGYGQSLVSKIGSV